MTANFFNVDDKDIKFLKGEWDNLLSSYTTDKTIQSDTFQTLREKYSENGRFYHNLSHVKGLLNLFESLRDKIHDLNAVGFAIWFHDIVYNTHRSDNEEASASLASEMLGKLRVNLETMESVRDLILATKDHSGMNLSSDAKLFLDMDLAILGASEEVYKAYSRAIRAEYAWVSEAEYRKGRTKILKGFIERERIYFTDDMKGKYEEQARKNIDEEIKSLAA